MNRQSGTMSLFVLVLASFSQIGCDDMDDLAGAPVSPRPDLRVPDIGTSDMLVPYDPCKDVACGDGWECRDDGLCHPLGPDTVEVPGTEMDTPATLGSDDGRDDEAPQYQAQFTAFRIDRHEVSIIRWMGCLEAGVCEEPDNWDQQLEASPRQPIVRIPWDQAQRYCTWLGGTLPTEAQWEYAARGTDARTYPWGNDEPDCTRSQYVACQGDLMPVSLRPGGASPFGAHDMAGNAWEWTMDYYASDAYVGREDIVLINPQGPDMGETRVVRGGAFDNEAHVLRTSRRGGLDPAVGYGNVGFRCVYPPVDDEPQPMPEE